MGAVRRDGQIAAVEVKSADADSISGMREFLRKYPRFPQNMKIMV